MVIQSHQVVDIKINTKLEFYASELCVKLYTQKSLLQVHILYSSYPKDYRTLNYANTYDTWDYELGVTILISKFHLKKKKTNVSKY